MPFHVPVLHEDAGGMRVELPSLARQLLVLADDGHDGEQHRVAESWRIDGDLSNDSRIRSMRAVASSGPVAEGERVPLTDEVGDCARRILQREMPEAGLRQNRAR